MVYFYMFGQNFFENGIPKMAPLIWLRLPFFEIFGQSPSLAIFRKWPAPFKPGGKTMHLWFPRNTLALTYFLAIRIAIFGLVVNKSTIHVLPPLMGISKYTNFLTQQKTVNPIFTPIKIPNARNWRLTPFFDQERNPFQAFNFFVNVCKRT